MELSNTKTIKITQDKSNQIIAKSYQQNLYGGTNVESSTISYNLQMLVAQCIAILDLIIMEGIECYLFQYGIK